METLGPLAALLTALGSVLAVLWRMTTSTNARVDTITENQVRSLSDERDFARRERDEAIRAREAADREADRWVEKYMDLSVRAARLEVIAEGLRTGMGPNAGATP